MKSWFQQVFWQKIGLTKKTWLGKHLKSRQKGGAFLFTNTYDILTVDIAYPCTWLWHMFRNTV